MSAHEDAIVAAADAAAYPLTLVQRPDVEERVRRYVNTYLAALPPSIVVDGKVVEVSIDGDVAEWLEDACATAGISLDAFAYVIDAARGVEK